MYIYVQKAAVSFLRQSLPTCYTRDCTTCFFLICVFEKSADRKQTNKQTNKKSSGCLDAQYCKIPCSFTKFLSQLNTKSCTTDQLFKHYRLHWQYQSWPSTVNSFSTNRLRLWGCPILVHRGSQPINSQVVPLTCSNEFWKGPNPHVVCKTLFPFTSTLPNVRLT